MSATTPVRRLFRIVTTDPPPTADFLSYVALGKPLSARASADVMDRWQGISMYDTLEGARRVAGEFGLGSLIAMLDLPEDGPFRIARTRRRPGHFTVWGDPDALCACVVAVLPVYGSE